MALAIEVEANVRMVSPSMAITRGSRHQNSPLPTILGNLVSSIAWSVLSSSFEKGKIQKMNWMS